MWDRCNNCLLLSNVFIYIAQAAQEKKQKKKAKKRKRKLTQVKPIHQPDDSNSDKTPLLANLAFSSTLTQQMVGSGMPIVIQT